MCWWYIKSLYRHLFLVDISKHASVTQKRHFLICGKDNSKAPWPTRPQIGLRVAKALSCDTDESNFFLGEPPLSYGAEKRRDHRNLPYAHAISVVPPLLASITKGGGGVHRKFFFDSSVSQLSALATLRPIWGRVSQGAFELSLPQIRKCLFFLSDPCVEWPLRVWIYLLRKYAYRDFIYHLKAHTISNKLV